MRELRAKKNNKGDLEGRACALKDVASELRKKLQLMHKLGEKQLVHKLGGKLDDARKRGKSAFESTVHLPRRRITAFTDTLMNGGLEAWAMDIKVAAIDVDQTGDLSEEELRGYVTLGETLIKSYEDFLINNGVVGALFLSMLFGRLVDGAEVENLDEFYNGQLDDSLRLRVYADITSTCLLSVAAVLAIGLIVQSARLHTQISFWMPNMCSKVWYAQKTSTSVMHLETIKRMLILLSTGALIIGAFRQALVIGVVTSATLGCVLLWIMHFELWTADICTEQLEEQTRMVLPEARIEARNRLSPQKPALPYEHAPASATASPPVQPALVSGSDDASEFSA